MYCNRPPAIAAAAAADMRKQGAERATLTLERFAGSAGRMPNRWSTERSGEWKPLATELVVEVQYDHFSGGRFRHGTRFLRWRPDKDPRLCTLAEVAQEASTTLDLLE